MTKCRQCENILCDVQGSHSDWKNLEKWEGIFQSGKSQGILNRMQKSGKIQGVLSVRKSGNRDVVANPSHITPVR